MSIPRIFFILLGSATLAACSAPNALPAAPKAAALDPHFAPTADDVRQIQSMLYFKEPQVLALKPEAAHQLSKEQLEFAIRGLEVSNHMAGTGEMIYSKTADGTLIPAGTSETDLQGQAVCDTKIQSVSWLKRGNVWSASNIPTACGTWVGNRFNSWEAWSESVKKTPNHHAWDKKYGTSTYWSMFNQFQCHFLVVRGKKTPWNLEPSAPNVGYPATVIAGCNPK